MSICLLISKDDFADYHVFIGEQILSTESSHLAIASGIISDISRSHVSVRIKILQFSLCYLPQHVYCCSFFRCKSIVLFSNELHVESSHSKCSFYLHFQVSFSKRLRLPKSNPSSMSDLYQQVWRIDKDEVATSFTTMR